MIAETAQHADHADIIRESLDGAKSMDNVSGDSGGSQKPLTYLTDKVPGIQVPAASARGTPGTLRSTLYAAMPRT
jgi:hypothetical protein